VAQSVMKFHLENEVATANLAADFALALARGDCIALEGDLGTGKSTFARALIRALAGDDTLEVPSPTFTLVQSYDSRIPVNHFDLYRVTSEDELDELGLDDALENGAALIEWPTRANDRLPLDRITLSLTGSGESRDVEVTGPSKFMDRLARSRAARQFLDDNGHLATRRQFLMGDASSRRYELIGDGKVILMDAPKTPDGPPVRDGLPYSQIAHLAEDVSAFMAIAGWLRANGFSAPDIPAADLTRGLLLVEHLGDGCIVDEKGIPVPERYEVAIDCLAELHAISPPEAIALPNDELYHVPPYDARAMQIEVELLTDWYLPSKLKGLVDDGVRAAYIGHWQQLFEHLKAAPKSLVLRDYHSPNLIWRPDQSGLDRIGIIDFQDALIGPQAYDVASLVQDARVTVPDHLARRLLGRYEEKRRAADPEFDSAGFQKFYAIMAAQRACKILGIFIRLNERDGKPGYLKHLPRMETYLAGVLTHDALAPLRSWFAGVGIGTSDS